MKGAFRFSRFGQRIGNRTSIPSVASLHASKTSWPRRRWEHIYRVVLLPRFDADIKSATGSQSISWTSANLLAIAVTIMIVNARVSLVRRGHCSRGSANGARRLAHRCCGQLSAICGGSQRGAPSSDSRILPMDREEESTKLTIGHTGDQESWPAELHAARMLVRKLACMLARQAAREDHAAEQARERALRCELRSTHDLARTCRTSAR